VLRLGKEENGRPLRLGKGNVRPLRLGKEGGRPLKVRKKKEEAKLKARAERFSRTRVRV